MKQIEWQFVMFVGSTLIHDFWIYYGLPKVYYWEVKQDIKNKK